MEAIIGLIILGIFIDHGLIRIANAIQGSEPED
jgi:hypothetical protein